VFHFAELFALLLSERQAFFAELKALPICLTFSISVMFLAAKKCPAAIGQFKIGR
jgi:hypothetical protein